MKRRIVDVAVYNKSNELQLFVEIKIQRKTSPEWATKLMRNRCIHEFLPNVPFFLLTLPDVFYLWKNLEFKLDVDINNYLPNYQINPQPFLQSYFPELTSINSEAAFSLVILTWLNHLINNSVNIENLILEEQWLIESGLLNAIQDGRIEDQMLINL